MSFANVLFRTDTITSQGSAADAMRSNDEIVKRELSFAHILQKDAFLVFRFVLKQLLYFTM